jgi:hypothetical protein
VLPFLRQAPFDKAARSVPQDGMACADAMDAAISGCIGGEFWAAEHVIDKLEFLLALARERHFGRVEAHGVTQFSDPRMQGDLRACRRKRDGIAASRPESGARSQDAGSR